ncbi:MAG: 1-deoxy-D-xylulose-5-phosphate reductoisomerase [Phycisphaeraceae bacterium]|nr:1-deoxy-D-xylulose-5-phosphate reductoisomerase [Phycisphaeraceae bacterium]
MPSGDPNECRVILLGSTGSIGTQTLDVIEHLNRLHEQRLYPMRFRVVGLAAGRNGAALADQARRFDSAAIALADENADDCPPRAMRGGDSALRLVQSVECDVVLAAMVGAAGLPATLEAARLGRNIALANKETLVAAGELVVPAAVESGSRLLPVDSEHAALWQCLQGLSPDGGASACPPLAEPPAIARAVITASGGSFRTWTREETYHATVEQALKHPTWSMGPKVTIDSASLTNKALEVIEAHWLFNLPGEKIGVLVHPQSIVHAMVEHHDGSIIAQLAAPDMRNPIQYALTWPHRPPGVARRMDFRAFASLEFSEPDTDRFPALKLAYQVIERGGTTGATFNAANEAAVEAFLARRIPFGRIPELSGQALLDLGSSPVRDLADVQAADREARRYVASKLGA